MYCKNTQHLKYCTENFTCTNTFPCGDGICVPFYRVCDGILHCVNGADETICNNLSCPGMLKCRNGPQCVHHSNICDGIIHCTHYQDDESMCDLLHCPLECICKGHSVKCAKLHAFMPALGMHSKTALRALIISSSYLIPNNSLFSTYPDLTYLYLYNVSLSESMEFHIGYFKPYKNYSN